MKFIHVKYRWQYNKNRKRIGVLILYSKAGGPNIHVTLSIKQVRKKKGTKQEMNLGFALLAQVKCT